MSNIILSRNFFDKQQSGNLDVRELTQKHVFNARLA